MSADNPNALVAHTVHDTTELPAGNRGIRLSVSAAGNVVVEDRFGTAVTLGFEVGTFVVDIKELKLVKATGLTATLRPANTVHARCVKAIA